MCWKHIEKKIELIFDDVHVVWYILFLADDMRQKISSSSSSRIDIVIYSRINKYTRLVYIDKTSIDNWEE
jgi:hypothetical protein